MVYKQIVVPLDGSSFSEAALPLALALTRRTGAGLHLVTVVEPISQFAYEEWEVQAREWSERYLKELAARLAGRAGGDVTISILNGHVVELLQKEMAACQADVVVMATHGRGAFSRAWLGSVADGFVRHADQPVILVRPDEDEDDAAEPPSLDTDETFDTLLVPLDGGPVSESALAHAVDFGELFDAAYHLTRIVPYPLDLSSVYLPQTVQMNQSLVDEAEMRATAYLEEHAERLRKRGLRVITSVAVHAQAGHGILVEAREAGCDLIAMATHGRTGLSRAVLGSAADKVLRGAHVPVLLYRSPKEAD